MKRNPTNLLALAALATLASAHAATYTWDGSDNPDNDFTTVPTGSISTWAQWNDYTFSGTPTTGAVNVDENMGWGNISLNSGLSTDIVIGGTSGKSIIMAPGKSGVSGWLPVDGVNSLGGTITIDTASKNLTINNTILIAGTLNMNVGAGRTLTANGAVNVWAGQGLTASLKKLGAGTVVLTAANNYNGGTTIEDGTLQLSGSGTLGSGALTLSRRDTRPRRNHPYSRWQPPCERCHEWRGWQHHQRHALPSMARMPTSKAARSP